MLFSSIIFIVYFLPIFLGIYLLTGLRTAVLLTGSVVFYTWGEGEYVFLLAGLILLNFYLAQALRNTKGRKRTMWLIVALIVDLGVLGTFKYANFVGQIMNNLVGFLVLPSHALRLPLGISFFTFQLISYLVDVYREDVKTEDNLWRFATYILMFPHLIAGPIVRYSQIREELASRSYDRRRLGLGLQYFIAGLCQKVLIANTVAVLADHAFGLRVNNLDASVAWLGILAYTLQIYFDFSGYSNMAIGLAFMLGFTFPKNFDYPYAARSITDFWRRWHMSLSFWFRDYLYIPLGGNRGGRWKTIRNLLIVFFLTGLWHGAAWKFIVWGLFHGTFLLLERAWLGAWLARLSSWVGWAYTIAVVMVGWVFFRADNLTHALLYLRHLFDPTQFYFLAVETRILLTPEVLVALVAAVALSFPIVPALLDAAGKKRFSRSLEIREARLDTLYVHPQPVALLLGGFVLSCALLSGSTLNPFLYFRF
jgi:alginate O-acetyltransferase complex protein AlgI